MVIRPSLATLAIAMLAVGLILCKTPAGRSAEPTPDDALNRQLAALLKAHKFTGRIEEQLEERLGRRIDTERANLGRFLFFDRLLGVKLDNACAGCHSPLHGFGDSQPMAIGIDNNNLVGPHRRGPRNMRRTPMVLNNAFYPKLMWNSRFVALSDDPFDNSEGFQFPPPEGLSLSKAPHLLVAQAFIPPTERNEMAGFAFQGNNDDIRAEVMRRLNDTPNYRRLFRSVYPGIDRDDPIRYEHLAAAIAEFEFALMLANAPIDKFARGDRDAMTLEEAIAHHLNVYASVENYTPVVRLPDDLRGTMASMDPVLDRLDPRLRRPIRLTDGEFGDLVAFVRTGLLDARAKPENFARLIPRELPSELEPLDFEPPE